MEQNQSPALKNDIYFMELALKEAEKCLLIDEVPVGAIVVWHGEVVGTGYNRRETDKDPLAHAEILAIKEAAETLGGWRILDSTLYVTLEPCPMCAGAIIQSRINRLIYGAKDPKGGACGSKLNLMEDFTWNHKVEVLSGVLDEESSALLKNYFKGKRKTLTKPNL